MLGSDRDGHSLINGLLQGYYLKNTWEGAVVKRQTGLADYEAWLKKEGYQNSTTEVSMRHIRAAALTPESIPGHRVAHVRRYLRYVADTRKNPLGRKFAEQMLKHGFTPARRTEKQGSRSKACLSSKQWKALRSRLRTGDARSKLLVAYMESPHRVGDFLNLRANEITADDVSDKLSREWIKSAGGKKKLYRLLCSTQRCAYYRLRSRLQHVSEAMKLSTDLDTLYKSYHETKT